MAGFGSGFSMAASQSLKNNRSLKRERGTYFKNRSRQAHRYIIPKSDDKLLVEKSALKYRYHRKLWKTYAVVGILTMMLTWMMLQLILI
ncbi:MAG: hypothetical protein AAF849_14385 [Bacteroidota bacterium]